MNMVIAFRSRSFPATSATDPAESESYAAGVPLLTRLLDLLEERGATRHSGPTPTGSGSSAYVTCGKERLRIHLTWYATGGRHGSLDVVWTLQVGVSRGWTRQALRRILRAPDVPRASLFQALEQVLRDHTEEFFDVRTSTWAQLDQ
jgi:hypothetical protein